MKYEWCIIEHLYVPIPGWVALRVANFLPQKSSSIANALAVLCGLGQGTRNHSNEHSWRAWPIFRPRLASTARPHHPSLRVAAGIFLAARDHAVAVPFSACTPACAGNLLQING